MKIGFSCVRFVPHIEMFSPATPQLAVRAEALGFESCWMSEHIVKPLVLPNTHRHAPGGKSTAEPDTDLYDPCVALATVAAVTTGLQLGTIIYVLPLRNPFVTARTAATLDTLSGGRFMLGTGVGWLQPEFEIVGETWSNRGARTDEIMQIVKRLWTEPEPEFHGAYYDFPPCKFEPKPPRGRLFGSGGVKASVERSARWCDGWIADPSISKDHAALAGHIAELNRLRAEHGRAHEPFEITMYLDMDAGKDTIARLEDLGVTRCVVKPWTPHGAGVDTLAHGLADLDRAAQILF